MTPAGSVEREDSGSDGFRTDMAFNSLPLDPINPVLAFMGQPSPFSQESSNPAQSTVEPPHLIHLGSRTMPFPSPVEYQQRLMSFFTDIHLSHPCIDEAEFRSRSEHMLANTTIQPEESHFLALNYLIFACCDVLLNTKKNASSKPVGWQWLEFADDVLDKKSLLSGNGDLTLIQCLLFQVSLNSHETALPCRVDTNHTRPCTTPSSTCPVQPTIVLASLPDSSSNTPYTSNPPGPTSLRDKPMSAFACFGTSLSRIASSR